MSVFQYLVSAAHGSDSLGRVVPSGGIHPAITPRCQRIAHHASEPPFLVRAVLSVILRRSIKFYCHGRGLARAGIALPWHWGRPGWEMCHNTPTMAAGLQGCPVFAGVPRSADFLVKEFPSRKCQGSSSLPFKSEVRYSIRKTIDRILLWIRRQYFVRNICTHLPDHTVP